jgi:Homeodomain-like domain
VIRNFNADGFGSLYPKYKGGRPPKFTLAQRREIKKIAKAKPAEYDLPFSTWSLAKLAEFPVAEGVVGDISHVGLRVLLREASCGPASYSSSWLRAGGTCSFKHHCSASSLGPAAGGPLCRGIRTVTFVPRSCADSTLNSAW